jgi:hypothetical protein
MPPDVPDDVAQTHEHEANDPGFMSVGDTTNAAPTGHTVTTEDSGSDGEVQSTPEGFAPTKPYIGMKFDTWEAAKMHYNQYA